MVNQHLYTKDAFWHSKNVTVYDSVVKGEYLAWYAENIKFVRFKIMGTQPLWYTKGVTMEEREMIHTDFAFEYSTVDFHVNSNFGLKQKKYSYRWDV